MKALPEMVLEIHAALDDAGLAYAFGGALALAWCTRQPRGTSDIDINIFTPASNAERVLAALPREVVATRRNRTELERDGQSRLWWESTPVDVFLSTDEFHDQAMSRVSREPFEGALVPFLSCQDLAVFKAFFDRLRDWADLQDMVTAGTIDADSLAGVIVDLLGPDDARLAKLRDIQRDLS